MKNLITVILISGLNILFAFKANAQQVLEAKGNPIITDKYTADPSALVYGDSVYLYVGHDVAPKSKNDYEMNEWLCYASADMKNWKAHKSPLSYKDFSWSKGDAWASQVIERNGKFYWYVATAHATIPGKAIGVAVADNPRGPFKDAIGKALVTNDMTKATDISWDDIDPTVIVDDDGQAYLFWGNTKCYYAKLKANMVEFDGPIQMVSVPAFTEAPWVHKRKGWYYLSYASGFPEKIVYAMSKNINGPWEYKGIINEIAGNSNTNHQSIIDFKGKSYFVYHNGAINTEGGSYRRSVCIDYLHYNANGTIKRIIMTSEGVSKTQ
ncbi:glycoside hydrolase family 43 protein [Pedobacter sp. Leaf170]|uniref:glycoside hydrolase family 43 protein n=1 Tax=Pedobacter sp. Leaf170 TaxID=2876558 RepID=UPI001E47C736|nr:glycoside hydrolase family 43 protein [Pedobacter sp. Leaf170]